MNNSKGPYIAIWDGSLAGTQAKAKEIQIQMVDDVEEHTEHVEKATAGHLSFFYVPLNHAKIATKAVYAARVYCKKFLEQANMEPNDPDHLYWLMKSIVDSVK